MEDDFVFSRAYMQEKAGRLGRFLEIIPGTLSWGIILGMLLLALLEPVIAALIMVAFILSWFMRMVYSNIFLILSYIRLQAERNTDWLERIRGLDDPRAYYDKLLRAGRPGSFHDRISLGAHRREVAALLASGSPAPSWDEIYHLVIFPVARERREIFEPGVASVARGDTPGRRIVVILAVEERAPEETKRDALAVRDRYAGEFLDLHVVFHPSDVPGEARVKGANATHAARFAARYFADKGIPAENVIASCLDADTVVSPRYFSCLTYHFIISPDRTRVSFQPIPVYQNNLWDAPGFARVLDTGSSFFQLVEATNPEKLVTFSSHSMSFKALVDVDYWPVDMISDDSAIFWKALLHFRGAYRVVPMYVTVSMDITQAETWRKTVVNVYKQKRRWAWGVESVPLVITGFMRLRGIPFTTRLKHGFKLLQTHISWTTWPFLMTVMSWLPAFVIARDLAASVVTYNEPRLLATLFNLSFLGYLTYVFLSQIHLPRARGKFHVLKRIAHVFEWLLLPPISLFFGAVPALDAQTRLMTGRYLEFWVTVKSRKQGPPDTGGSQGRLDP